MKQTKCEVNKYILYIILICIYLWISFLYFSSHSFQIDFIVKLRCRIFAFNHLFSITLISHANILLFFFSIIEHFFFQLYRCRFSKDIIPNLLLSICPFQMKNRMKFFYECVMCCVYSLNSTRKRKLHLTACNVYNGIHLNSH